jgi:DNA-binding NarL/FixJ family response regulator
MGLRMCYHMDMRIRILLVDDHRIIREGLQVLLTAQEDFELAGEAENGHQAVAMTRELSPDVVVMDIAMPDLNGVDATRQIISHSPNVKVVVLSANVDQRLASQVMAAGAMGLIPKEAAFEELALAIRTAIAGKIYISPRLPGDTVVSLLGAPSKHHNGMFKLTSREREVLQLMAEGNATKAIAFHLHLSVKTVETHRRRLMTKLGIDNVAGLTKYAVREGLTGLQ